MPWAEDRGITTVGDGSTSSILAAVIPEETTVPIRSATLTPLHLIFQDVALNPATLSGNTSSPVSVTIQ